MLTATPALCPSGIFVCAGGRRVAPEVKSLVAATAFDDLFRDSAGAESSGASGG